jgi:hypothetical protein
MPFQLFTFENADELETINFMLSRFGSSEIITSFSVLDKTKVKTCVFQQAIKVVDRNYLSTTTLYMLEMLYIRNEIEAVILQNPETALQAFVYTVE